MPPGPVPQQGPLSQQGPQAPQGVTGPAVAPQVVQPHDEGLAVHQGQSPPLQEGDQGPQQVQAVPLEGPFS